MRALQAYSVVKSITFSELVRWIIVVFGRERVSYTLQHLDMFIRTLETQAYTSLLAHGSGVTKVPFKPRGDSKAGKKRTDGAANFHEAYLKEFYTRKLATRTEHIREIALNGVRHNNNMERMNGEIRDRERVMRTLERADTPILTGMQIYHNYVRPHEGLKGKTPADVAGIEVRGKDKWLTLIQNASRKSQAKCVPIV